MKTAKEPYMNYSENYASTLSFFNALVRNDLEKQGRQINEKFFGLFSRSGNFVKFIPYLEKKITKEDLDQIAAENNQRIERSYTKAINYDKLSGITYAFAILQSYGVGGEAATKKIDGLISSNFEELKELLGRSYSDWSVLRYTGSDDPFVIPESVTIPENVGISFESRRIAPEATVVNNGSVDVWRQGSIEGALINNNYFGSSQTLTIDGRVENSNHSCVGYIRSDGRIENSNHSCIGYVRNDGRVENSNHSCIGRVDGVTREWAAAFFFFFFN